MDEQAGEMMRAGVEPKQLHVDLMRDDRRGLPVARHVQRERAGDATRRQPVTYKRVLSYVLMVVPVDEGKVPSLSKDEPRDGREQCDNRYPRTRGRPASPGDASLIRGLSEAPVPCHGGKIVVPRKDADFMTAAGNCLHRGRVVSSCARQMNVNFRVRPHRCYTTSLRAPGTTITTPGPGRGYGSIATVWSR